MVNINLNHNITKLNSNLTLRYLVLFYLTYWKDKMININLNHNITKLSTNLTLRKIQNLFLIFINFLPHKKMSIFFLQLLR